MPYIHRHAGTIPNQRQNTRYMDYQFCYIGSGIGWVSTLIYYRTDSHTKIYIYTADKVGNKVCFLIIIRQVDQTARD